MTRAEFAQTYFPMAEAATKNTGLFPETLLVQAILESRTGASYLSTKANNFFGIKAGANYNGNTISLKTKEFLNNKWVEVIAKFRAYNSAKDSFADWVSFLQKNKRYAKVFEAKTPIEQLEAIAKAGYATDPNYASLTASIYTRLKDTFSLAANAVKKNPGITAVAVAFFFNIVG